MKWSFWKNLIPRVSQVSLLYHRYFYRKFRGQNTIHSEEILQPPRNHWTSYWLPVENFSATLSNFHPTGIFRQRDDSFHWNLSARNCFTVREKSKLNQIWPRKPYDPFPLENVPSISIFWIFIHPLIRARDKSFSKLIAISGNKVC